VRTPNDALKRRSMSAEVLHFQARHRPPLQMKVFTQSLMSLCDTPKHENAHQAVYDRVSLRGTKAVSLWSGKPATQSGLDIAPDPELSPRFSGSTRSRLFDPSMSSGAAGKL
jgi:hypothetical protein